MAAKGTIAEIRRKKKEFSDMLSTTRKAWMSPYEEIKGEADEIARMFDDPIKLIETQVKECEAREKEEKKEKCKEAFNKILDGSIASEYLTFESAMKTQWLNVSVSMASVKREITAMKEKIEQELSLLEVDAGKFLDKAIEEYKNSGNDYVAARKKIQELKEFEEYMKKQEESARQKEEEKPKNNDTIKPVAESHEEVPLKDLGENITIPPVIDEFLAGFDVVNPFLDLGENPFTSPKEDFTSPKEGESASPKSDNPFVQDEEFVSILVKKSDLGRIKELLDATGFAYKF